MADMVVIERDLEQLRRERERDRDIIDRLDDTLTRHDEQINGEGGVVKAIKALADKVDGLSKALWAFAASFLIAALTIAVTLSSHH